MSAQLFKAGRVRAFTEGAKEGVDCILVAAGRVLSIDRFEALKDAKADLIDLGAATITPGLVDAHIHITEWAVSRKQVDLAQAHSIEEAARMVGGHERNGDWILGHGWNPHHWGGAYPHRSALDAIAPAVPVVLQSHDMHALWVNSCALRLAGIDESADDPDGGRILRDARGRPTGVLLENAAQLVSSQLPRYTVSSIIPLVVEAQRELHSYGITGIHSFPGVHRRDPDPFPVLQTMLQQGTLALRVLQHISLDVLDDAIRVGLRSGFGNEWLRIGAVKMFLDGALGSRTAWMREPYEESADCGVQVLAENDFRGAVEHAARNGIATTVHAIGDAAVTLAFAVLNDEDLRVDHWPHRVEHVQCLPPETRIAAHVICSVQPSHLMTDWRAADRHWGRRAAHTYAFRSMLDQGATILCGSDAPVEAADPRHGLYAAVARKDLRHEPAAGWQPRQRLRIEEVFRGYTTEIRVGGSADFVAWDRDPLRIDAVELLEMTPVATVVNGEIVYGG